jgi:hypothetical protein
MMSAATYLNTALKTHYNAKASNGTMGILRNGTRVLIIQRRLKNIKIRQDGPPGKRHALPGRLPNKHSLR